MKKPRTINVAFCIDKNFLMQTCVSIASLLISARNKCRYGIYCIVSKDFTDNDCNCIKEIVNKFSKNSTIDFRYENSRYNNAKTPSLWSKAIYHRLMLPDILQDLDKIIYIDSDTISLKDLIAMDKIWLKDKLLGGCLDIMNDKNIWRGIFDNYHVPLKRNQYINSGVMIMNLEAVRKTNLSQKWINLAKKKNRFPTQDILNSTCLGQIHFIDPIYNMPIYTKIKQAYLNAKTINKSVILHFIYPKPWQKKSLWSEIWWEYAKKQNFMRR
jgi:lipopolysaccharide biosynthesis glycosyltransferase